MTLYEGALQGACTTSWLFPKFLAKMDRIIVTSPNMKQSSACLKPFIDKMAVVPLLLILSIFTTKKIIREEKYLRELALATK